MISYWNWMKTVDKNKLTHTIYKFMLDIPIFESKWIPKIKSVLNEVGKTDIRLNQEYILNKNLKKLVKITLTDQHQQKWYSDLQISN